MNSLQALLMSLLITLGAGNTWAQDSQTFYQGPGEIDRVIIVSGTVIGIHPGPSENCYLILADLDSAGMGGAGRFFLCGSKPEMKMGQQWSGKVVQTDTRMTRVGQRWRPMSVFRQK